MGHKVHPTGRRLGITESHRAVWYVDKKQYAQLLLGDLLARQFIRERLKNAFVGRIQIERLAKSARITIFTARPGVVIGKKGEDIESLRVAVSEIMGGPVQINIEEIRRPELDAYLVAENVAQQLERRVAFRRVMKRAISNAMRFGAEGIKIRLSGRLGGAEIARIEWQREGRVPLHTFRAEIDYALTTASTTYGIIGVKVWIFKGEILDKGRMAGQVASEQS